MVLCATTATVVAVGKFEWEKAKLNFKSKFDLPFDINIEYTGDLKDTVQLGIGLGMTAGGAAMLLFGAGGTIGSGGTAAGITVPVAVDGVAIAGAGLVTAGSALGNMFDVSISKSESSNTNSSKRDSNSDEYYKK